MIGKKIEFTENLRSIICCIILLLIIAEEFFFRQILTDEHLCSPQLYCFIGTSVILLASVVFLWIHKSIRWPNLKVFRKILQNLASSWLLVVIISFFLIHINWVSSAGYDALFGSEAFDYKSMLVAFTGVVAVFFSLCLNPYESNPRPINERTTMISGLSLSGEMILPQNIDLLIKPFIQNEWTTGASTAPINKLFIIPSCDLTPQNFEQLTDTNITNPKSGVQYFSYCTKEIDIMKNDYNNAITSSSTPEEVLQKIIKVFSGKDTEVKFADKVDYDDMKECLKRVDDVLSESEMKGGIRDTGGTLLYITPGTGVIGSALTAFSIPGDRSILYYGQAQEANRHVIATNLETGAQQTIISEILNKD